MNPAVEADRYLYVPFIKKERASDGSLIVTSKVTGDQLDLDEQITDRDWAREALADWFKAAANIRQMHSPHLAPAGKGMELEEKEDGFYCREKIVEPGAIKLVEEGVYTGNSIGIKAPRIIRDAKAKNGRIVGGKIVEVSLVDYPCLESAKFVVAKMAGNGAVEYIGKMAPATLTKCVCGCDCEAGKPDPKCDCSCPVCKGIRDGAKDSADKAARVAVLLKYPEAIVYKRDYSQDDRDRMAKAGHAMPDGSFPIADEEDLKNAVQAHGRAKDPDAAKQHIIRRAKALGKTDMLPSDWDGSTKKDDEKSVAKRAILKRLHDLVCPCYDLTDVLLTYPEVAKNGLAASLGPQVRMQIFELLQHELEEDGGKGTETYDIQSLANIYCSLTSFVQGEQWEAMQEQISNSLRTALADRHKAYEEMFPGPTPMPSAAPMPSAFVREYLRSGHARQGGTEPAHADHLPDRAPNSPEAQDFERGPLTAGQERPSPSAQFGTRPAAGQSARTYYTNASKEQVRAALRNIHDSLSQIDDNICPMGPQGMTTVPDNGARNIPTPTPLKLAAEPDVTKAQTLTPADLGDFLAKNLPSMVAPTIRESVSKALDELLPSRDDSVGREMLTKVASVEQTVTKLQQMVDDMARQPDPREAGYRGPALDRPAAVVPRPSEVNKSIQRGRTAEEQHEVAILRSMAQTADPGVRGWATGRLEELGAGLGS